MTLELVIQTGLIVASVALGAFCIVLARRLRKLNDLESGLGGAIAVMAAEVDRLEKAIKSARDEASGASEALAAEVAKARKERAVWELRQKIAEAAPLEDRPAVTRRLRKRAEVGNA